MPQAADRSVPADSPSGYPGGEREYYWNIVAYGPLGTQNASKVATDCVAAAEAAFNAAISAGASFDQALAKSRQIGNYVIAQANYAAGRGPEPVDPNGPAGATAGAQASPLDPADVKNAQQQYVEGIQKGKETYNDILSKPTNSPGARSTFREVKTPGQVGSIVPTPIGPAARQEAVKVQDTDLSDLNATARGQGAGQQSAAARYRSLLLDQGRNLNGTVQQMRGKDRAAGRLAQIATQGEAGVAAGAKIAESDAQTSLAAQTKVAEFTSQKNALQADLDSARAAGDANRVQEITRKIADIEMEAKKANADIAAGNIERNVKVQESNNAGRLAAEIAGGNQDIAQNDLRLRAQKALEDSAHGVLTEDSRQEAIAMARRELANAEARYQNEQDQQKKAQASSDRSFWTTTLTSLLAIGATSVGGPAAGAGVAAVAKAAHGGAVQSPRTVIVGEAGNAEIIVPVKGKLSQRLAQALSIEAKPFEDPKESGEIDTPDELTAAIKKTLGNFRAKMGKKMVDDEDDAVSEMAAATLRSRRSRSAV